MTATSGRHERFRRGETQLQMTPMIDVVFLLLIFFVCTASFQAIEYVLPSEVIVSGAGNSETPIDVPPDLDRLIIDVGPSTSAVPWRVNDRPCHTRGELRQLLESLATVAADLPAILDCQPDTPLGDAIATYDLCRELGFEKVQFAASEK
jgi:biopolymer transport protein ExbD